MSERSLRPGREIIFEFLLECISVRLQGTIFTEHFLMLIFQLTVLILEIGKHSVSIFQISNSQLVSNYIVGSAVDIS